ncbi:MAG: glucosamine-6-phosphate deaminase [Acidimicrobiia bacterium]
MSGGATVHISADAAALATLAVAVASEAITTAVRERGVANVMFASGNSQFDFLDRLVASGRVEWERLVGLHMDEYVGIGPDHPASFARYMQEKIIERVSLREFHLIDGRADPKAECDRYAALLADHPLDLCVMGIGENGHLAFNDPPVADFSDPQPVKVVELDAACRAQQVGEGHFARVDEVPPRAITVTIPALLRARSVIVIAPESRKARPVAAALDGPVTTACPASILQLTPHAQVFLDPASAADLRTSRG